MINLEYLELVLEKLKILSDNLYLAERTIDKRRKDKNIREARTAIYDFASSLDGEVKGYLDREVGVNALAPKWEYDIGDAIRAIEEWINKLEETTDNG